MSKKKTREKNTQDEKQQVSHSGLHTNRDRQLRGYEDCREGDMNNGELGGNFVETAGRASVGESRPS